MNGKMWSEKIFKFYISWLAFLYSLRTGKNYLEIYNYSSCNKKVMVCITKSSKTIKMTQFIIILAICRRILLWRDEIWSSNNCGKVTRIAADLCSCVFAASLYQPKENNRNLILFSRLCKPLSALVLPLQVHFHFLSHLRLPLRPTVSWGLAAYEQSLQFGWKPFTHSAEKPRTALM